MFLRIVNAHDKQNIIRPKKLYEPIPMNPTFIILVTVITPLPETKSVLSSQKMAWFLFNVIIFSFFFHSFEIHLQE